VRWCFWNETDRKTAEVALHDSESRLRLVQEVGGIAYTDRTIPEPAALISSEFADIYGLSPGLTRVLVADIIARVHPDDQDRIRAITPHSLEHGGKFATEFRICRPDGAVRWISMRTEAFLGPSGLPNRIISAQRDITEIVVVREALAIRHDELKRLSQHLIEARDQADRANLGETRRAARLGQPISVILIDIDHFQDYNGCYGHPAGDECLREVASAIRGCLQRAGEFAARYGGEEIVVLLPGSDTPDAVALAETMRLAVRSLARQQAHHLGSVVTFSAGVATWVPGETAYGWQALVGIADTALYAAKAAGRNMVSVQECA
jgi:diguanylate cyclase (GGDEF)-like protein/PAS domain S-box-containing protein